MLGCVWHRSYIQSRVPCSRQDPTTSLPASCTTRAARLSPILLHVVTREYSFPMDYLYISCNSFRPLAFFASSQHHPEPEHSTQSTEREPYTQRTEREREPSTENKIQRREITEVTSTGDLSTGEAGCRETTERGSRAGKSDP